ncbi:hypothetical protein PR002_g23282 [Phytophthora rubi]|uniref:Uncharacterized protein n=1 Tax=Phytophthora rubi TaxID=129364 RepID=A0A6A3IMQ1_9STRA|nr:hypothetical protein PR002_g23282 [Phytophthora rubi]
MFGSLHRTRHLLRAFVSTLFLLLDFLHHVQRLLRGFSRDDSLCTTCSSMPSPTSPASSSG